MFENAAQQPSAASLQAARIARHRLSCFWLSAPVDQLEELYSGVIGDLQRLQLSGPLVQQDLARDEQQWADQLKRLMATPAERSRQLNILLALMPYTQPAALQLQDPIEVLPSWLLADYVHYSAPELEEQLNRPAGLLGPASEPVESSDLEMEPLTERRGEEAMVWFRDDDVLERMSALIQAYSTDACTESIKEELGGLRNVVAQLWLDVEPIQLPTLWTTAVGDVTRSLIQSGFGAELLEPQDEHTRRQLAGRAQDFEAADAPGVVLATLLFYPSESISFASTEGLPPWFIEVLQAL